MYPYKNYFYKKYHTIIITSLINLCYTILKCDKINQVTTMNKLMIEWITRYQNTKSLHKIKKCRFLPTCSEYAKICYQRFNFFYASFLTIKRILKCNPFHKIAYDPVPEKRKDRVKWTTLEDALFNYYLNQIE